MKSNNELDSILDKVTAEIRNEAVDSWVADDAAERVWARISAEDATTLQTAAMLVIGFGLLAIPLIQRYAPFGQFEATVQAADGQVYRIDDTTSSPITVGQRLQKGERIRTAKDAHAFIRLGDGSLIEVSDRAELSLTRNLQGTTIHLDRGNIIVEAAKQRGQHLFVDTGDARV